MGVSAASVLNQLLHNHKRNLKPYSPATTTTEAVIQKILTYLEAGRVRRAVSILFAFPEPFPFSFYAHLFRLCSFHRAIVEARKVESHLLTFSPNPPTFLLNRAIEAYGKCSSLRDARELFDEMPQRDGGSWNALITAYSQMGYPDEALSLFLCMNRSGFCANEVTFASVLASCASASQLLLSRQVHGLVTKFGFCGNVILESSLVDVYAKCGVMDDARKMFHEIPRPNAVTWNVIVRRYLDVGDAKESVFMFSRMFLAKVRPLNYTFSNALVACSSMSALEEGMQIHGAVVKLGLQEDNVVTSSLINMYVKCGKLEDGSLVFNQLASNDLVSWTSIVSGYAMSGKTWEARKLFDEMPERNVISWNAMLAGYTRFFQWSEALDFVYLMLDTIKDVDHVTLCLMLNVSAGLSDHEMGKRVHGYIYRHGFHLNLMVSNALLDMYGKCGNLNSARVWFNQMSNWRDRVSWNALLASYGHHHLSEQALTMFSEMQWETKPTKYTFGTLLAACANTFALHLGKQIHAFIIRHGFQIDTIIRTALVYMYSKCRCLEYAIEVLKGSVTRDVIIWNTIILGCCHNHRGKEGLELFGIMLAEGIKPDHVTFQGILLACVEEGLVEFGAECFKSMSNEYCVLPRLEHYDCMIELYSRHGYMDKLENFMKTMTIEPTIPMLTRALDACHKNDCPRLGECIREKLNEFKH
ncbi:pentatricopeptide repeat-containing protein At3g26540 [Gastrolobium bilobum]|uniref:pentatricopeptide repeat-containing protein At3g26540 n=1 Tax=Gastrolobium bilobum TaxID=150636 RepID=UPI002AB2EE93|nr:pentatricopeptide repeat-containing protein At3g26540 [Gastrolobium bilobum]